MYCFFKPRRKKKDRHIVDRIGLASAFILVTAVIVIAATRLFENSETTPPPTQITIYNNNGSSTAIIIDQPLPQKDKSDIEKPSNLEILTPVEKDLPRIITDKNNNRQIIIVNSDPVEKTEAKKEPEKKPVVNNVSPIPDEAFGFHFFVGCTPKRAKVVSNQ